MNARAHIAAQLAAPAAAVLIVLALLRATGMLTPDNERAALAPPTQAELAQVDAQARALCARERHQQAGYIQLADGFLVCDKPARRPRSDEFSPDSPRKEPTP